MELKNNLKKVRMATLGVMAFTAGNSMCEPTLPAVKAFAKALAVADGVADAITAVPAKDALATNAAALIGGSKELHTAIIDGKTTPADLFALGTKDGSKKLGKDNAKAVLAALEKKDRTEIVEALDKEELADVIKAKDDRLMPGLDKRSCVTALISVLATLAIGGGAMYAGFIGGGQ